MDQFVEQQKDAGSEESQGHFTISPKLAREKMRDFQLAHPGAYIAKIVQAANRAGVGRLDIKVTRASLVIRFHCEDEQLTQPDCVMGALLSSEAVPDSSLRHLIVGLNAAAAQDVHEVLWQTAEGTVRLTRGNIEILSDSVPDVRFVVRKKRTLVSWFRGTVYLEETRFIEQRCRFGSCEIRLDGRALSSYPRWDSFTGSKLDHIGLGSSSQNYSLAESLDRTDPQFWVVGPPVDEYENVTSGFLNLRRSSQAGLDPIPLLYRGEATEERQGVSRALSIRPVLVGDGWLGVVKDGVLLEPVNADLGHPGVVVMTGAGDLKTDLSEFQIVRDSNLEEHLSEVRAWVTDQARSVSLENLEEAFRSCAYEPQNLERRLGQIRYWLRNGVMPEAIFLGELVETSFPDSGFYKMPTEDCERLARVRKVHSAHLPADEPVLGIYDDTLMGSAKEGFVITEKRLCWKNSLHAPQFVLWQDLLLENLETTETQVAIMKTDIGVNLNRNVLDCLAPFLNAVKALELPPSYSLPSPEMKLLQSAYTYLGKQSGLYYFPHIPKVKFQAAKESYCPGLPAEERPLVLYDDTLMGGADNGLILTGTAIYWRNVFTDPQYCTLEDLAQRDIAQTAHGVRADEDELSVHILSVREAFVEFFRALRDLFAQ